MEQRQGGLGEGFHIVEPRGRARLDHSAHRHAGADDRDTAGTGRDAVRMGWARRSGLGDPPVSLELPADAVRLQQVLWNVLKNAVKFTPDGGRITVADEWSPEKRVLTIRISDTGIGMVPSELERIFDRFYQADLRERKSKAGSGLGLSIGRWIADAHGAELTVESTPQQGSVFQIKFPVKVTMPPLEPAFARK